MLMLYPEPTQSPLYTYPMTLPVLPLPLSLVPLNRQLAILPNIPYSGQLLFPPPAYVDDIYYQVLPLGHASTDASTILAPILPVFRHF
jgi:hypothetical protein